MNLSTDKKINIGFSLILALIVFVFIISLQSINKLVSSAGLVTHTNQVIKELDNIYSLVNEGEAEGRGYIISSNDYYIKSYGLVNKDLNDNLKILKKITIDNPEQQENFYKLKLLIKEKFEILKKVMDLTKNKDVVNIKKFMNSGKGRGITLKREISDIITRMENEEKKLLVKRELQTNWFTNITIYMLMAGSLLALLSLIIAMTMFNRDLNRRKLIEKQLRENEETLEKKVEDRTLEISRINSQLEKLVKELERSNTELNNFASVASHDLQEPLRTIASYTQLLEKRYRERLDESGIEFLEMVIDASKRMHKLINDLLNYSRVGTENKKDELIDLNKIMGNIIVNLKTNIEENNAIINYAELPTIRANETLMYQLFQNLITNAVKYRGDKNPVINISADKIENKWIFSVLDNGIGINSQYFEKIFNIFQRLHGRAEYEGTGIGLATCKKIVEICNGKIWVESEEGKGSTFFFTLPV